jgi:hypothetical protein
MLACALTCALCAAACSERYTPEQAAQATPQPQRVASQMRVFDAGDRPRPIWDDVRVGWIQQLTWHPHIDGRPWAVRAEVEVIEVRPDGAWLLEQRIIAAMTTAQGAPSPPPFSADSLRIQWLYAPGAPRPALSLNQLPAPLPDLHKQLQALALQLPTDPIGEGAFWDVALSDTLAVGVVLEARAEDTARARVDWPADEALPTVRLLWSGQEPRQLLRYSPTLDRTEAVTITLHDVTTRTDTRAAVELPTSRSSLSLRVTERDGDALRFAAESTSDAHPEPVASAGVLSLGQGPAPTHADAAAPQLTWGAPSGAQWVVGLPREPVGVGARWAIRAPVTAGPWSLQRLAIYTLERIDGDTLTLRVEAHQTASDINLSVDGPRKALNATLHALDATERGTLTLNLTRLLPTADLSLDMRLWVTPHNSERPTLTHTKARLTITPASPP